MEEMDLPPFRAINHEIPLIDVNNIYPWRPSRCPEAYGLRRRKLTLSLDAGR